MKIIAPSYALATEFLDDVRAFRKATELPLFEVAQATPSGVRLEFSEAGQQQELPVPLPRLPGLDDLEVEQLAFEISSDQWEESTAVAGQPSDGSVSFSLGASAGAARLVRIEIDHLIVNATSGQSHLVPASGAAGTLANVAYIWNAEEERTDAVANGTATPANFIHLLIRPASGSGFGPPAAAAPHFAMPGAGGSMYGPALGGARLDLTKASGEVRAVLRLAPVLQGNRFALLLGTTGPSGAHAGLPNEITPVSWSARSVRAIFDLRPTQVKVEAATATLADERPLVAEFPSSPDTHPASVDFAPAARNLLRETYPRTQEPDLGLKLVFTAGSVGALRVDLGTARARYLAMPLADTALSLSLRGAPETIHLQVPESLRPSAFSFTLDGVFGPARLTVDSDQALPESRRGFRVAGPTRLARPTALTAAEAHLPLSRIAVYGRASEETELLLTIHGGDRLRIGPPLAEPVSIELSSQSTLQWHRIGLPGNGLPPPHPDFMWVVARATRGVFWWAGDLNDTTESQRSADDGETYAVAEGRPLLQLSVLETDAPTGHPWPLYPLTLFGPSGHLNEDLIGLQAIGSVAVPPDFRRFWIAQGPSHEPLFTRIGQAGGLLPLSFFCRRDVELSLSEATLTYDPWRANR